MAGDPGGGVCTCPAAIYEHEPQPGRVFVGECLICRRPVPAHLHPAVVAALDKAAG